MRLILELSMNYLPAAATFEEFPVQSLWAKPEFKKNKVSQKTRFLPKTERLLALNRADEVSAYDFQPLQHHQPLAKMRIQLGDQVVFSAAIPLTLQEEMCGGEPMQVLGVEDSNVDTIIEVPFEFGTGEVVFPEPLASEDFIEVTVKTTLGYLMVANAKYFRRVEEETLA